MSIEEHESVCDDMTMKNSYLNTNSSNRNLNFCSIKESEFKFHLTLENEELLKMKPTKYNKNNKENSLNNYDFNDFNDSSCGSSSEEEDPEERKNQVHELVDLNKINIFHTTPWANSNISNRINLNLEIKSQKSLIPSPKRIMPNTNNENNQIIINSARNINVRAFKSPRKKIESCINLKFSQKHLNDYSICNCMDLNNTEGKKVILVVDDSEQLRKSIINILFKLPEITNSYKVIEGNDGIDILKFVIQDQILGNKISMIFTDENMEYISGSESIQIIRNLEYQSKIKNVKIISLTAFEDSDTKNHILSKGADYVLTKQISLSNLKEVMKNVFI